MFKYRDGRSVVDVRSSDVNAYVKEHMGDDFSTKDFRTWAATVAAAVALDELGPCPSPAAAKRAVSAVVRTVANVLGNTPAVCRSSYIDRRVIDRFLDGGTIAAVEDRAVAVRTPRGQSVEEALVLALLRRGLRRRASLLLRV